MANFRAFGANLQRVLAQRVSSQLCGQHASSLFQQASRVSLLLFVLELGPPAVPPVNQRSLKYVATEVL